MDHSDIQERLRLLKIEIFRLRAANDAYSKRRSREQADVEAHKQRGERLHDILAELADISKRIKAA
jgi:hypothetical protein